MEWLTFFIIPSLCIICMAQEGSKKCGPPLTVNNGDTITLSQKEYPPGSFVEYRCQMFYLLEGHKKSFCENGTWTDAPRCLGPCFISLEEMAEWRLIPKGRSNINMYLAIGDSIEIQCISGYVLQSKLDFKVECKRNQTVYPKCIATTAPKCTKPPSISHGDVTDFLVEEYSSGSTVRYKCQNFYKMEGSSQVTCQDGKWSAPPSCLEPCIVTLGDLEENNIKLSWTKSVKQFIETGSIIEFFCKDGYRKDSQTSQFQVQCSEGKLQYPRCVPNNKECRAPPSVKSGDIITPETSKYATGSVVEYGCQDHHILEGSHTITCQHGMWTEPPTCRDVGCGVPPEFGNADVIGSKKHSYLSGETVHYQCHTGFQNTDSKSITCSGGKWTGSPLCFSDFGSGQFNYHDNAVYYY